MTDWRVQLTTADGQVKTVTVYDYNYPSDAERAALSQTGGQSINWSSPFIEKKESTYITESNEDSSSYSTFNINDIEVDYSTKAGLIQGYICTTLLPTIILWCINPIPAILFNIAFARWWFTD